MNDEAKLWQAIQRSVGVRPDGDPGPATAAAVAAKLGCVPPVESVAESVRSAWPRDVRAEMDAFYGPPGHGHTMVEVPYPLWIGNKPLTKINVHEKIAPSVQRVLSKVLDHYGLAEIKRLRLDQYDGCFNNRPKRGGASLSTHAYAAALDFGAAWNELRWDHTKALYAGPEYEYWWRAWEAEGAVSLGRARDFDWMHVQFARLP